MRRCVKRIDVVCIHLFFEEEGKMLNIAIRIYYVAVPACMMAQTLVLGYMAVVLNMMRRKRNHESRRT